MNAVYDHIIAILVVGMIFVGAVVILPTMSLTNLQAVDQQQLRNTALNVFNAMLLDTGEPVSWGSIRHFKMNDPRVKRFGLASFQDSAFYVLDPDKVQRLVVGNPLNYCEYDRVRELLGLQDYGFRLRIIPPFNVTFLSTSVTGDSLHYKVRVSYLDGIPIPNAQTYATVISTRGKEDFDITQSGPVETNAMGICEGIVKLGISDPDYYMVTLRVTVADVATLVVTSGQTFNNTIAIINIVYDTLVLTSTKDPPNYNEPPNPNVWILDIVAIGSDGSLWYLHEGTKADMFNTGQGSFELWDQTFYGLHDFEPVILIFNFWAVDEVTDHGRQQVLIVMAYPDILGTSIFDYGGSPKSSGGATVKIQRSVVISSMTYTAELWLWKESP
ncbi:MAG: hypothetical protein ACP5ER_05555 [Candidatus Bathyarchaeales archaeon]